MSVKIKSDKACVTVINGVSLNPQITEISDSDYDKIKDNETYKFLKSKAVMFEINEQVEAPVETEEVTIDEMTVSQLKDYAKELGLVIPEGIKKADLRDMIKDSTEE
jgi:hypothetical protein